LRLDNIRKEIEQLQKKYDHAWKELTGSKNWGLKTKSAGQTKKEVETYKTNIKLQIAEKKVLLTPIASSIHRQENTLKSMQSFFFNSRKKEIESLNNAIHPVIDEMEKIKNEKKQLEEELKVLTNNNQ